MKKMLLFAFTFLLSMQGYGCSFEEWITKTTTHLESRSEIAQTPRGPIEYVLKGKGPIVLCLHGGFGGYDQALLVGSHLTDHGFRILAPSRPGYLRTPLSVGQTNEEQADAMVDLLDALGIDKVSVIGFSAGSQIAFLMAVRHPDRVKSIVCECLGAQPDQTSMYTFLTEFFQQFSEEADFAGWLFHQFRKNEPRDAIRFILSIDSSLPSDQLEERIQYVLHHRSQKRYALKFIDTITPLGPRIPGIINDISPTNLDPWPNFDYSALHTPTLIIQSQFDSNGYYPEAQLAASRIAGAELLTLAGCGHFIWLGTETKSWEKKLRIFLMNHQ